MKRILEVHQAMTLFFQLEDGRSISSSESDGGDDICFTSDDDR